MQQPLQHLLELALITADVQVRLHRGFERALRIGILQLGQAPLHQQTQVHALLAQRGAGHVGQLQQSIDQPVHARGRLADPLQVTAALVPQRGGMMLVDQPGIAADRPQRRTQVMRNARREHFLLRAQRLQRVFGFCQPLLGRERWRRGIRIGKHRAKPL